MTLLEAKRIVRAKGLRIKEGDYRRSGEMSDDNLDGFASEANEAYYNAAMDGISYLRSVTPKIDEIIDRLRGSLDVGSDEGIVERFELLVRHIEDEIFELESEV
jgi:hypothetical protein